nr:LOW QUALITY PROTEIN: transient receptor potential protein-like [Lepeophtheirus salmonis]
MTKDSSMYGSKQELMSSNSNNNVMCSSSAEKGGHNHGRKPLPLCRQLSTVSFDQSAKKIDQVLTPEEKRFILLVERGDCASVKKAINTYSSNPQMFDINCTDPLGRSALSIAIINENPELMELLLDVNIEVKDALLLAISEEYVEGVEILLHFEEQRHKPGTQYSWEMVDHVAANYTPDITPLILAAHKNNYEILKILLDRGASLPTPHDLKCSCESCITASQEDSLRFSLSRINAYRALASPSLIALTSTDPILTAFQLSDELKKLRQMESQFSSDFNELRGQVQKFATDLLDHARTSYELEIMLNYDLNADIWDPGEMQTLERLKLALKSKQKEFVAHPNVQQLLATIWYEGLPGWRRMNVISQTFELGRLGLMFPIYCIMYMLAPTSEKGGFMKNPFVKFICHSASFLCFLTLLAAASQRFERLTLKFIGTHFEMQFLLDIVDDWVKHERGSLPSPIECVIIFWVFALIWKEIKEIYEDGLLEYICDLWNLADCFTNMCFLGWIILRATAYFIVKREESMGINPYYPREEWHAYDPYLIAEGLFGAGMISSYLKLVHIFSINPHLGPLQISLGRMAVDILKFIILYLLVMFAFGCGMNQLLWYYADLEYNKCYSLPGGLPDLKNQGTSCVVWRRFANLFETSQSLFWASFGMVSLTDFELTGIKEFTRFWALLMFGSYSICNIIVLLNMLIAMMSNSYQIISAKSDVEWKFARTKLWISYFETGATVPPPFNIIPTMKGFLRFGGCQSKCKLSKDKEKEVARKRYSDVIKCIVRRYITAEQKKTEEFAVTEDDVSEIRQDINKLRYEMIDILKNNNFKTPEVNLNEMFVSGRRAKQMERRVLKGFNIATVDTILKEAFADEKNKGSDIFKVIAKVIGNKNEKRDKLGSRSSTSSITEDPIGSTRKFQERRANSFRNTLLARGSSLENIEKLSPDQLIDYNPKLKNYTPHTRLAYAKFKSYTIKSKDGRKKNENDATVENIDEKASNKPVVGKKLTNALLKSVASYPSIAEEGSFHRKIEDDDGKLDRVQATLIDLNSEKYSKSPSKASEINNTQKLPILKPTPVTHPSNKASAPKPPVPQEALQSIAAKPFTTQESGKHLAPKLPATQKPEATPEVTLSLNSANYSSNSDTKELKLDVKKLESKMSLQSKSPEHLVPCSTPPGKALSKTPIKAIRQDSYLSEDGDDPISRILNTDSVDDPDDEENEKEEDEVEPTNRSIVSGKVVSGWI